MKRCPECNSFFSDAEQFCDQDGAQLVTVNDAPRPVPANRMASPPRSNRGLLTIGVLMGVLLGVMLVLIYLAMSRQTEQESSNTSNSTSIAQQQQVLQPQQPAPPTTSDPSPEPSVEASPSPSVETPSPEASPQIELSSSNPISTAEGSKGSRYPVIIKLDSGLTIEADEAWRTGEGIWYRKNGVVSLIDPKKVKAIEKMTPAAPAPSASAAPSP